MHFVSDLCGSFIVGFTIFTAIAHSQSAVVPVLPFGNFLVDIVGLFSYNCFFISSSNRILYETAPGTNSHFTPETCALAAMNSGIAGIKYFGVTNGGECYYDIEIYDTPLQIGDCNMACNSSSDEICGGLSAINIWSIYSDLDFLANPDAQGKSNTYVGCMSDSAAIKLLTGQPQNNAGYTHYSCLAAAQAANAAMFGLEAGGECYYGNTIDQSLLSSLSWGTCDQTCTTSTGQRCGGQTSLDMYAINSWDSFGADGFIGCWSDNPAGSALAYSPTGLNSYYGGWYHDTCRVFAKAAGFLYYGMENGAYCFFGPSLNRTSQPVPYGGCFTPCTSPFNDDALCGGPNQLQLFVVQH